MLVDRLLPYLAILQGGTEWPADDLHGPQMRDNPLVKG